MNKSESIVNLAGALVRVQGSLPKVKFDAKNPFLKNKYATLGALIEASRPVLEKFGLSVSQFPVSHSNMVGVTSILMHESGEFLEDTILVLPDVSKGLSMNQSVGVSITYLRRYAYAAILGLVADEDGDGDVNAATGENSDANEKVETLMSNRQWKAAQTEAISLYALDEGLDPISAEDAASLLNLSVLPSTSTPKTIQSWFKRYVNSKGSSALDKAAEANNAYIEATKKTGGK
jgi:hypothetical protein